MSGSAHLAIPFVAATQNQKEVTLNAAIDALDRSANGDVVLASADANVSLTTAQARENGLVTITGALTATRQVVLPAGKRQIILRNQTTGGFALEVGYATGARAAVPPAASALLKADGTDCHTVGGGFEVAFFAPGAPLASQLLGGLVFSRRVVFPAAFNGSRGAAGTAATASASFTINRNGSPIGSIVFAAGATVASFAAAGETTCNPGDILSLTAPSPADAALANLYFNLRGRLA